MIKKVATELQITPEEDRVPIGEKLAYATGQIGNGISGVPKYLMAPLLVLFLGLSPLYISLLSTVFMLWDAITDPLMGSISDNHRGRFGRRRPFMLFGAISSALALPLMFLFEPTWSEMHIILWFVGFGILYWTLDTIFNMPYQTLLLEMTPDYNERTVISGYRGMAGKVTAVLLGWAWWFTQLPMFNDPETGKPDVLLGARWLAVIGSCIILLFCCLPAIFCKERYYNMAAKKTKKEPLFASMKKTLRCKPFLNNLALIMFFTVSGGATNGFGIYLVTYYVFNGDQKMASLYNGYGATISNICGILLIPVVVKFARTMGKDAILKYILITKLFLAFSVWFFYTPNYPWLSIIPPIFGIPLMTALWLVIPSMQADIVDYDELKTTERREGSFAAVFSWNVKAALTISAAISGPMLLLTGFDQKFGNYQPPEVLFKMRVYMMAIPLVGMVACMALLKYYPLSSKRVHEIRGELEARRGAVNEKAAGGDGNLAKT